MIQSRSLTRYFLQTCDTNMKILHVNANFPGSTNDAFIWRTCNLKAALEEAHDDNVSTWLLGMKHISHESRLKCWHTTTFIEWMLVLSTGDSGYPMEPWLFTPIGNPVTEGEMRYNRHQMSARSVVERCNGLIKMRWRCLLRHRCLHYRPEKASEIITACCVLHNMCVANNMPHPAAEAGDDQFDFGMYADADPAPAAGPANVNPILANARRLQRRLIRMCFD
jgi:hypothetical protein